MGTKISALTTTGSAPADSYIPIAYDGENYKVTATAAGLATRGGGGDTGTSMGNNETRNFLIGDLGDQQQILISASMRYSKLTVFPAFFQISATFGYPDSGATPVLAASANSTGYTTAFGGSVTQFYYNSFATFYFYVSETQAFIQVQTHAAGAGDIFWSYKQL